MSDENYLLTNARSSQQPLHAIFVVQISWNTEPTID